MSFRLNENTMFGFVTYKLKDDNNIVIELIFFYIIYYSK